jgi:hypothetical protein
MELTELVELPDLPHDDWYDAARLQILQGWGETAGAILGPQAVKLPAMVRCGGMREAVYWWATGWACALGGDSCASGASGVSSA